MRSDMAKVIVERPRIRGGSRKGKAAKGSSKRHGRQLRDGIEQSRETMKPGRRFGFQEQKSLNEHLGPLRRYLRSQIGRPWNKVFSEICQHVDRRSAVLDHVRDHVDDYVQTNVVLHGGVPTMLDGEPLWERFRFAWLALYVCPKSGILKDVKAIRPSRQRLLSTPRRVRARR